MKILFFNYEYPPLGGGAGNATYYLLREFSKIPGLEIDLVTSSTERFRTEKISDNITIHFLDINKNKDWHYQSMRDVLFYSWKSFWYSKKLIKKKQFDLSLAFFGIPCGFVAMKLGIPYIVSLRGSDVPGYSDRFAFLDKILFGHLSRKIWKKSLKVVALSHDLVKLARKNSSDQAISVIYNGINVEEFSPNPEILDNEKTFNILFVGRLIERKGLIYLLEAFKDILKKYPESRLLVAGDGPLKDDHLIYAKENKIDDKVVFFGRIDHEKMAEIYQQSHVFVLPSLNEALGNVTHEALASGLPIITTDTGASELIEGNGIIIKKGSSQEIREALEKIMENLGLRKKMSEKSREISEKMSWEKTAQKYYEIFQSAKK